MRGTAHIGVLKALEAAGLRPSYLAGTSAGALVAALYASGLTVTELVNWALALKRHDIIDPAVSLRAVASALWKVAVDYLGLPAWLATKPPLGLIRGRRFERFVDSLTGRRTFDDLDVPLAIPATDLITGESVIFTGSRWACQAGLPGQVIATGAPLATAVRASSAIPGVFAPVTVGGRVLVDGGVLDNVPAAIVRRMGATIVVAVDIGYAGPGTPGLADVAAVMARAVHLMTAEITAIKLARHAHIRVLPAVADIGLTDVAKVRDCIVRGIEATEAAMPLIIQNLSNLAAS